MTSSWPASLGDDVKGKLKELGWAMLIALLQWLLTRLLNPGPEVDEDADKTE